MQHAVRDTIVGHKIVGCGFHYIQFGTNKELIQDMATAFFVCDGQRILNHEWTPLFNSQHPEGLRVPISAKLHLLGLELIPVALQMAKALSLCFKKTVTTKSGWIWDFFLALTLTAWPWVDCGNWSRKYKRKKCSNSCGVRRGLN